MTLWLLVAAGGLAVLMYAAVALYLADLFTRSKRRRVQGTPAGLGLYYDEVQFRAPGGTTLRGWFMDSPGARATVVVVHDAGGTRADPDVGLLRLQRDYLRRGYNTFAFDLRGRGESSGNRDYLGSDELIDLRAAVAYARGRSVSLPLLLHGFGLGASLAIQAVAEGLPVAAVIADSPFASAREQLRYQFSRVPGHLFSVACLIARHVYRADVDALAPIRTFDLARPPTLLIHGRADARVPVAQTQNLAAASLNRGNDLWLVPRVGHCAAFLDDPDRYLERCIDFIETVLPVRLARLPAAAV